MQLGERIGRRIKLQDLHVLMTVIDAGSMGRAAAHLNITQPAISRAIAELENAFGLRLLDRHPKGVEPTEYGRALIECGLAMFDDLRQGVKKIECLSDPASGEVRVGSGGFLGASFVSSVIDRLSRRYPRIVFHLLTAPSEQLQRELIDRSIDLFIAWRFDPITDERLDFDFLFDDSFVVATDAQSSWARRRKVTLSELMSEMWVLPPPKSAIGSIVTQAFRARGFDYPRATVLTTNPEVRIRLLATGRFFTIFPKSVLRFPAQRSELKILSVDLPMARVANGIVTLKNRTISPAAQLFIEQARLVARSEVRKK
jgi:DNA-binding transcriptional LysR family regulator